LTYEQQADELENVRQMANDLYSAFKDISDLFMDSDSPAATFAEMGMSAADAVLNCFALQLQLKAARASAEGFGKAMNTAMAVVGWIVMGVQLIGQVLGAIFDAHDKKLQKQIDKAQEDIDRLTKEYEKLEKAIDKAFSADRINDYSRAASNNIDQQIKDYERMIALEEDKKKTDNNQIDDWRDTIEELREQQREMWEDTNSVITGGILDDVRDVARNFVDAWYEAFQETGDGLSGLEDDFNDMLSEIVKQQAALHIVSSYTDMYKDWLKEYVDAEHGDVALSAEEARAWAERVQQTFPELSTLLENFFTGTQDLMQSESEISGLSKGIQGVTETTAQVLEALLNSMRFYVADSNIRLRNIEAAFANDDIANNPLLNELRQQTALIRSIEEMFGSVIGRGNSSHSGAYLKVLM
jgi:tetratricopeptide (TPR) repeat protein